MASCRQGCAPCSVGLARAPSACLGQRTSTERRGADAARPRRAQFYNQIYNRTYGPFNRGSSLPAGANALNYTSPVLSSAIIPVAPNTQYFYQVSDSAGVCTGIVYNFWSAPGAHTKSSTNHTYPTRSATSQASAPVRSAASGARPVRGPRRAA